jgi:hypothetical protein
LGAFRRCLAIKSSGIPGYVDNDRGIEDWGFGGHGFWIQGGGTVALEDCLACGHQDFAIVHMGLKTEGRFKISNLPDGMVYPDPGNAWLLPHFHPSGERMHSSEVPIRMSGCKSWGNTYASYVPWAMHNPFYQSVHKSQIRDCVFADTTLLGYPHFLHFTNTKFLGGIGHTGVTGWHTFDNCHFETAFQTPTTDLNQINGGYINCEMLVQNMPFNTKKIHFDGTTELGPKGKIIMSMSHVWYDVGWMVHPAMPVGSGDVIFTDRFSSFGNIEVKWGDQHIYFNQQKDYDFTSWVALSPQYRKPLAELEAEGIFAGKWQLPADARREPWVDGWLSPQPALEKQ